MKKYLPKIYKYGYFPLEDENEDEAMVIGEDLTLEDFHANRKKTAFSVDEDEIVLSEDFKLSDVSQSDSGDIIIIDDDDDYHVNHNLDLTENEEDEEEILPPPEPEKPKERLYTTAELNAIINDRISNARDALYADVYKQVSISLRGEVNQTISEIKSAFHNLQQDIRTFQLDYCDELANFAVDVAEKFILHKIKEDDTYLLKLVVETVNSFKNAEWITVEVSSKLEGLCRKLQELANDTGYERVEFVPRNYPIDTAIFETESGIVDVSISTQAANAKQAFRELEGEE